MDFSTDPACDAEPEEIRFTSVADDYAADPDVVVTPEHGETVTAPASYFLDNWYGHSTAERVIQECAEYGTPGTWDTPQGVMMVRRA